LDNTKEEVVLIFFCSIDFSPGTKIEGYQHPTTVEPKKKKLLTNNKGRRRKGVHALTVFLTH